MRQIGGNKYLMAVAKRYVAKRYVDRIEQKCMHGDPEADHIHADEALCDLLVELGYGDVVKAWHKVAKWYS